MLNENGKEIINIELLQEDREKLQYFRSKVLTALFTICITLFLLLVCCIVNFSRLEKKYNNDCIAGAYYENINDISSYAVNDLTGTSWEFPITIINQGLGIVAYDINFTSNNENFRDLTFVQDRFVNQLVYEYYVYPHNTIHAYDAENHPHWYNINYRTIQITGGTDATNSTLISWLQANATQIQNSVTLDTPTIILRVVSDLKPSILIPYDSNVSSYVLKVNTIEYSIALNTLTTITYNNSTYYKLFLGDNQNYIGALSVKAIGDGTNYLDSDFSNVVNTYSVTKNGDFYIGSISYYNTNTINILDYFINCSTWYDNDTWNNKLFSQNQTNENIDYFSLDAIILKYYNVSSNIEISLNTENGVLLYNTTYYLDYSAYIAQSYRFENGSTILNKNFTSNGTYYNNIVLSQSNYFIYNGSNNDNNYSMVVISNLTGQYMPTNSYNYLLISFGQNQYQYLYANDNFFKLFRIATQEDYAVISAENDRLVQFNQSFTLVNLFGAVVDTQISALRGMLNFTMFGVNFYNFFVFVLAMALLYFVVKFVRGNFTKKE